MSTKTPLSNLYVTYPVAFSYDGTEFDPTVWNATETASDTVSFTSPDGKLRVIVTYRTFDDFPSFVEIIPVVECIGDSETGILENIRSLHSCRSCKTQQVHIRRINGSETLLSDFTRNDVLLQQRPRCNELHFNTFQGLSSAVWLPYFGVDFDALNGLEIAVGWSGAWRADMELRKDDFLLEAGLDGARFKMHSGERFLLPSMLIMERKEITVQDGLVQFHRLMLSCKAPRDSKGQLFQPWLPVGSSGGNKTDENMLNILDFVQKAFPGLFDVYWVDACWNGEHHEVP